MWCGGIYHNIILQLQPSLSCQNRQKSVLLLPYYLVLWNLGSTEHSKSFLFRLSIFPYFCKDISGKIRQGKLKSLHSYWHVGLEWSLEQPWTWEVFYCMLFDLPFLLSPIREFIGWFFVMCRHLEFAV